MPNSQNYDLGKRKKEKSVLGFYHSVGVARI